MRELTDAACRFTWSLSLFTVQQLINLREPVGVADALTNVANAMQHELNGALRSALESGGELTRGAFDAALDSPAARAPRPRDSFDSSADTALQTAPATRVSGWAAMPFPVIVPDRARNAQGAAPVAEAALETEISADYPFESHYINVCGSKMHYLDVGTGTPILLLHGNPTWSYIWRNVIPHLSPLGRCIAPDLIGYGRSAKPEIRYRWSDHVRYLDEFIKKLGLKDIILVLHDQGSGLGFHYAKRHEANVRGLAFFEAIIRPYPWDSFSSPEFRALFRRFRNGGIGGEGWQIIVEQNAFIEQLLPQSAGRPLTQREMQNYREPFKDRLSRVPIWRFARETPIGGEPADVWDAVSEYSEWLKITNRPKLLLYAKPGALVTEEHFDWARRNIQDLQTVDLGPGLHFLQESSPHRIGREIAHWIRNRT